MKRSSQGASGLLFAWTDDDRSTLRLLVAVLLTVGGLVGHFILFRVVYPESPRISTRPQQILMLNPSVPADLALIHQAMDRSFVLLPSEPMAEPAALPSVQPTFKRSVDGFQLRVKSLQEGAASATYPRLFAGEVDVLPPIQAAVESTPSVPVASASAVLRPVVAGDIAARLAAPHPLPKLPLVEPFKPRFQVAVGARGQVLMALPLAVTEDASAMKELHRAVTGFQFAPSSQTVQWGQVSFRWEQESAR